MNTCMSRTENIIRTEDVCVPAALCSWGQKLGTYEYRFSNKPLSKRVTQIKRSQGLSLKKVKCRYLLSVYLQSCIILIISMVILTYLDMHTPHCRFALPRNKLQCDDTLWRNRSTTTVDCTTERGNGWCTGQRLFFSYLRTKCISERIQQYIYYFISMLHGDKHNSTSMILCAPSCLQKEKQKKVICSNISSHIQIQNTEFKMDFVLYSFLHIPYSFLNYTPFFV